MSATSNLEGKAVVVTGASRGIGAGIAASLMAASASVLGVSRSGAASESARSSERGEPVHVQCDLLSPEAPEVVLHAALDAFGRVDALVNNAGVLIEGACWEQPDEELDAMLALNLTAPFRLSQRFAAHWLGLGPTRDVVEGRHAGECRQVGERRGVIVNVCSIESHIGWADPPQAAYAASKGGLLGLTRAMALELAPHGIRVVAVGPGVIATAMTPSDPAVTDAIPLDRRLGAPEEVGDVVAFLVSDAARYITGEIVYADGGYMLA